MCGVSVWFVGLTYKRTSGRERRYPSCSTEVDLWWETDVCFWFCFCFLHPLFCFCFVRGKELLRRSIEEAEANWGVVKIEGRLI